MTEYIIVVFLVAIAAIGVVGIFGNHLRRLMGASAASLAGDETTGSMAPQNVVIGEHKGLRGQGGGNTAMAPSGGDMGWSGDGVPTSGGVLAGPVADD
jgi:hypothetical protein